MWALGMLGGVLLLAATAPVWISASRRTPARSREALRRADDGVGMGLRWVAGIVGALLFFLVIEPGGRAFPSLGFGWTLAVAGASITAAMLTVVLVRCAAGVTELALSAAERPMRRALRLLGRGVPPRASLRRRPRPRTVGEPAPSITARTSGHRGLLVLLGLALVLRVAVSIAYWPVLFFADSTDYVGMVSGELFSSSGHPSGYPLLLAIVSGGLRSLGAISIAQHIAGLLTGVLVYFLLLRLKVPRWTALVAAGVVLFDAHLLAFEQHVGTETFSVLALVGSTFLLTGRRLTPWSVAAGSGLLAAAVTMRSSALFAVPVWLVYLLLRREGLRLVAAGAAALALPLVTYALVHGQVTGWYGLTESDGWLLYGRTAKIADCADSDPPPSTRPLCGAAQRRPLSNPLAYIWTEDSPPRKTFGPLWEGSTERRKQVNGDLRAFALDAVVDHPLLYARMIGEDVATVLITSGSDVTPPASLPDRDWDQYGVAELRASNFPSYEAPRRFPASALLAFQEVVVVPGLVVGMFALGGILFVVVSGTRAVLRRGATPGAREAFLLTGMGLAISLGSIATSNGDVRYLLTSIPLFVTGGFLVLAAREASTPRSI